MTVHSFKFGKENLPQGCELPAPKIFTTQPNCDPCAPRCRPKTRARDAFTIYDDERERCFVLSGWGCERPKIPLHFHCVLMVIRAKGYCEELMEITPYRATADGAACFAWPPEFLNLPSGYYEGDIYMDGKTCATVLLYLPPCRHIVTADEFYTITEPCEPCEPCEVGEVPQPDVVIDPVEPLDCGEC